MNQSKIIQRLIFDAILVAVFFLPFFTAAFLWNIFFRSSSDVLSPASNIPKFDDGNFNQLKEKVSTRRHFKLGTSNSTSTVVFGVNDPFNP